MLTCHFLVMLQATSSTPQPSFIMVILANYPPFAPSSSSPSRAPSLSPNPTPLCHKPELRMHKKGKSSVASVTFIGESYWRSRAPALVSLEAASQTPSIIKQGFEYMYHKSHGYRFRGGSLYFRPVPNLARKSERDAPPRSVAPTQLGSDTVLPPLTTPISSDQLEKHDGTIDTCSDSTKKVLKVAPLISLEEAQRREVSRRNRADNRALEKEDRIEREVSRLKREVAEIAWKKVQAKCEEESVARLEQKGQAEKALEAVEKPKRGEEELTLTAAVAAREGGLVVAPTNWIVPLISLDEARHTEKAKRDAAGIKLAVPSLSPPPPAVNSLTVNAGNGNTATLRLVSLEEACGRDRTRRLKENVVSRSRTPARPGTGLSHVSLITLAEARKQDVIRRNRSSRDGNRPKSSGFMSSSRKPGHPSPVNQVIETGSGDRRALTKDASAPQETAHRPALTSNAGNWWTRPNGISAYRPYTNGYS